MTATDELRETLGPLGIWLMPPASLNVDPASFGRLVEQAGFTSIWCPVMNSPADLATVEPVLAATDRLVLATGIASIWTWTPDELATAANKLAVRYPGRFILGIGVSHGPSVQALGQEYVKPYTKMVRFLDALPALEGPLVLAALGPRMLELARDRTAGAHPYFTPPRHTAFARDILGPAPLLIPEVAVALADGAEGAANARDYAHRYLQLPNYTNNLLRFGYTAADMRDGGSDRMISEVVPSGAAQARDGIAGHLNAGADHVVVQTLGQGGKWANYDLAALAELTAGLR
jgi:probable F420-dependent oxidoreductase